MEGYHDNKLIRNIFRSKSIAKRVACKRSTCWLQTSVPGTQNYVFFNYKSRRLWFRSRLTLHFEQWAVNFNGNSINSENKFSPKIFFDSVRCVRRREGEIINFINCFLFETLPEITKCVSTLRRLEYAPECWTSERSKLTLTRAVMNGGIYF